MRSTVLSACTGELTVASGAACIHVHACIACGVACMHALRVGLHACMRYVRGYMHACMHGRVWRENISCWAAQQQQQQGNKAANAAAAAVSAAEERERGRRLAWDRRTVDPTPHTSLTPRSNEQQQQHTYSGAPPASRSLQQLAAAAS